MCASMKNARIVLPLELKDDRQRYEHKRLPKAFAVTMTDEAGSFDGYGAVFNDPHPTSSWMLDADWKDVIMPGAFTKTLAEFKKRGTQPSMLYMHERGYIVGAWRDVHEDKDGLVVKGQAAEKAITPSGAGVRELLKMGALTGMSIGFRAQKVLLDEENQTRELHEVELGEISLVDIPGGPSARVTDVKAADPLNAKFLERILRDAGLSRSEAKALLAEGLPALRDVAADPESKRRDADSSPSSPSRSDLLALCQSAAKR